MTGLVELRGNYHFDRQSGGALILLMLILVVLLSTAVISIVDPESKEARLEKKTNEALARAKEALIAYAITRYDENPGVFTGLPCVDDDSGAEGTQDLNCGTNNANKIGMLPWKDLEIGPLKDGAGDCLWYAVSGPYKPNNAAMLVNEDSPGLLMHYASDGITPITANNAQERLVAAVFSPGPAMPWQDRTFDPTTECGGDYDKGDFLESVGNATNDDFSGTAFTVDGIAQGDETTKSTINDRLISITRQDIWNAIQSRLLPNIGDSNAYEYISNQSDIFEELTAELAECIADYGRNHGGGDLRLPWAVPVDLGTPTVQRHSQQTNYDDASGVFAGRYPFDITNTIDDAGYSPSNNYPWAGTLFTEGYCTEFVDLSDPNDSNPPLPQNPDYPLYRNLWNHWKDHIFYAVAEARAPGSANPSQTCSGSPNRCLAVNGNNYAAIVMFAGSPWGSQSRNAPPDGNDKEDAFNYLDDLDGGGHNADILNSEDGDGSYQYEPGNDIMVCIEPDMSLDIDCSG